MTTALTRQGNDYALVIDKPMLDQLNIRPDTPLEIKTDGKSLVVSPEGEEDDISDAEFEEMLEKVNNRFANVLRRLA